MIIYNEISQNNAEKYYKKREFELLGKEMPELENEKEEIAKKMIGNLPFDQLQQLSDRALAITRLLEEKEMRWLELSE